MFKKYMIALSLLMAFGYANAMGKMMGNASGFMGSLELEYESGLDGLGDFANDKFEYEVQVGWAGEVNNMVHWKVSLFAEDQFGSFEPSDTLTLGQAYIAYMPMDGVHIVVGKKEMHCSGMLPALCDSDLFAAGAWLKYMQKMGDTKVKFAVGLNQLDGSYRGPYKGDTLAVAKLAVMTDVAGVAVKAGVAAEHAGLFNEGETGGTAETLAMAYLKLKLMGMGMPVNVNGVYSTDVANLGNAPTYAVNVMLGNKSWDANNFNLGLHYYDIDTATWNTSLVDGDYGLEQGKSAKGAGVTLAYNVLENTQVKVRYGHDLDGENSGGSAQLKFKF